MRELPGKLRWFDWMGLLIELLVAAMIVLSCNGIAN